MRQYAIFIFCACSFFFATSAHAATRVLVVPGHDDVSFGASYHGVKEADLTLELGEMLFDNFNKDSFFEPYIVRTKSGYSPLMSSYFDKGTDAINQYRAQVKASGAEARANGSFTVVDGVNHNNASEEVGFRLYGINKWASDHGINIVVHIHFNDIPRGDVSSPGQYSGFAVYVPDLQYRNGKVSQEIAKHVYDHLSKYFATSDLNKENAGVVSDQDLIAIGSNNSLSAESILIEYSYIYEPQITDPAVRSLLFKQMADETYAGIKEYFSGRPVSVKNTLVTTFNTDLKKSSVLKPTVLALQSALQTLGFYPAKGMTKNDCPLSGKYGPCTESAVKAFQKKYGISQLGIVGPQTRAKLNKVYFKP